MDKDSLINDSTPKGRGSHSTAVTQQPHQHTSPTSPIQNEFEVLHNFWLGLVNLTRYHNFALLNVNLNWRKHLETQDCESVVPVNNTVGCPSTELGSSSVSYDSVTVTDNNDQNTKSVLYDKRKQSKTKQKCKSKTIKKHGKFLKLHSQRLHKMKHKPLLLERVSTHMSKKKKTLNSKLLKIDHIFESIIGTCYTI